MGGGEGVDAGPICRGGGGGVGAGGVEGVEDAEQWIEVERSQRADW